MSLLRKISKEFSKASLPPPSGNEAEEGEAASVYESAVEEGDNDDDYSAESSSVLSQSVHSVEGTLDMGDGREEEEEGKEMEEEGKEEEKEMEEEEEEDGGEEEQYSGYKPPCEEDPDLVSYNELSNENEKKEEGEPQTCCSSCGRRCCCFCEWFCIIFRSMVAPPGNTKVFREQWTRKSVYGFTLHIQPPRPFSSDYLVGTTGEVLVFLDGGCGSSLRGLPVNVLEILGRYRGM
eukprot:Nk52_evm2s776 gene=Nk52_evmTU2s776